MYDSWLNQSRLFIERRLLEMQTVGEVSVEVDKQEYCHQYDHRTVENQCDPPPQ